MRSCAVNIISQGFRSGTIRIGRREDTIRFGQDLASSPGHSDLDFSRPLSVIHPAAMTSEEISLLKRYRQTRDSIDRYAEQYRRSSDSISLIAVSKRHRIEKIIALLENGHLQFAENFMQEGVEKIDRVAQYCAENEIDRSPCWHFIGHIQSRKCKMIAEKFDWVHTIESIKVADRLDRFREGSEPLNALIQLNLQGEESKSGISVSDSERLACHIGTLPNLKLRGLMIIPKPEPDFERQRFVFQQCREQFEYLNRKGHDLDQLSMGMTADMEAAIAEGATQIRIGTAVFGPRPG